MIPMQVAAVIPTYNRKDLLLGCLQGVLQQTRPVDAIILVDNASVDGTAEALRQAGYSQNSLLHCIRLEENVGSAGAYSAGLAYAHEQGYEWFWLMDDDAIPKADTLEHLLRYTGVSAGDNIGGLVSYPTPGSKGHRLRTLPKTVWEAFLYYTVCPVDVDSAKGPAIALDWCTFISFLLSRKVVDDIGLPRSEFYIDCEDIDFTIRARKAGYNLYVIKDSLIDHGLGQVGEISTVNSTWRYYYRYRNHIANLIMHRDYIGQYITVAALMRITLGALRRICIYAIIDHDYASAKLVWRAVLNGYTLKLGKYGHETPLLSQSLDAVGETRQA